jgi:hypothetical protein
VAPRSCAFMTVVFCGIRTIGISARCARRLKAVAQLPVRMAPTSTYGRPKRGRTPVGSPDLDTETISVSSSWHCWQRRNLPTDTLIFSPGRRVQATVTSMGYSLSSGGSIAVLLNGHPRLQGHLKTRTTIRARHCSWRREGPDSSPYFVTVQRTRTREVLAPPDCGPGWRTSFSLGVLKQQR